MVTSAAVRTPQHVRVAIVGSGFAGLGAAIALQREGVDYVVLERADDVGGTWRDNTYPGCRCDVPSHLYSFSFALNPDWSETYSPQPEIWDYLRRITKEYGVAERIRYGHDVREAAWDSERRRWNITTSAGSLTADVLVAANGPLAEPKPDVPGLDDFEGTVFHSAQWRWDHDLAGRRIAVVGTGCSSIQFVPEIRKVADRVTVFQRTPGWVVPHTNRRIRDVERAIYRRAPALQRFVRVFVYWSREVLVGRAIVRNGWLLSRIETLAVRHLHSQIRDPALRAKVTPNFTPGCKRLMPSNDWYPALAKPNVELVPHGVGALTATGVIAADGSEHAADTVIFGTGFHVTDNPIGERIRGAGGQSLQEHWENTGACAYNGTAVTAFPNLFLLAGPNTGIGHTSLLVMVEAQIGYLVDALRVMGRRQARTVEVRGDVYDAWSAEIQRKAAGSAWNAGGCASWYLDAEGRNTTMWPDQTYRFVRRTKRFDAQDFELAS